MIDSRKLTDLHPRVKLVAEGFLQECKFAGIDVLVISTYRDAECQNFLYSKGRTLPGSIVTNAKAGQSFHNYRVAFDVVIIENGKPLWSTKGDALKTWQKVGEIGKEMGLEWAGDWKRFKEFPHFQYTGGLTIKDFKAGKRLK